MFNYTRIYLLFSDEEKKAIREIYTNAISLLSDEDKKLPQIANILPNLLRGIGVHHSGLFPMLKEVTEILFGEGLIKVMNTVDFLQNVCF